MFICPPIHFTGAKMDICLAVWPCFLVASPTHSIKDYLQVVTELIMTKLWWDRLRLCHIAADCPSI